MHSECHINRAQHKCYCSLFVFLCGLPCSLTPTRKQQLIDWIYAQQIQPDPTTGAVKQCGFRGGSSIGVPYNSPSSHSEFPYDDAHIAQTYSALCCLKILGDDLGRVNKRAVIGALKYLQQEDGR